MQRALTVQPLERLRSYRDEKHVDSNHRQRGAAVQRKLVAGAGESARRAGRRPGRRQPRSGRRTRRPWWRPRQHEPWRPKRAGPSVRLPRAADRLRNAHPSRAPTLPRATRAGAMPNGRSSLLPVPSAIARVRSNSATSSATRRPSARRRNRSAMPSRSSRTSRSATPSPGSPKSRSATRSRRSSNSRIAPRAPSARGLSSRRSGTKRYARHARSSAASSAAICGPRSTCARRA